ncbi:MAG TPA: HAD family hydrolase [Flavitalea sp.]|nr:HAD family hydrolase [Flavitalea sp.]
MKNVIAFFDFDGTITTKDSLLEFIRYVKGDLAFYFGFFLQAPVLILYKLQMISNQRAKEIILAYFFGNMDEIMFMRSCENFIKEKLPSLIRPKALIEIKTLKNGGAEVVIVSASPQNWIRLWCESQGLECIATKLVVADRKITGRIEGKNCHGKEKVNRITTLFNLQQYSSIYAYGDTPGDRHMLALANIKFYKPFR